MTQTKQQIRQYNLGMPYMGSKRKLSKKIIDEILNANPNTKYLYDLFGGGGAISFEAMQRTKIKKVFYNELNTGVAELLKKIQNDGVTEELYQWIDRETFMINKDGDCWFGGLCKVVWSFGNNQSGYMFGKDVEPLKKLGHEAIVFKNKNSLEELSEILNVELPGRILDMDITKGRQQLSRIVKKVKNERYELQKLERLQQLQQLQKLEQLQRLQQLEQLEQLERLQQLEISNMDYKDVDIETPEDETIIYLDPPYEGTGEYQEGGFCHRELEEYIKKSPYKIYVSSYKFSLPCVGSFKHRTTLSANSNNEVTENLYCNKPHKDLTRLF